MIVVITIIIIVAIIIIVIIIATTPIVIGMAIVRGWTHASNHVTFDCIGRIWKG